MPRSVRPGMDVTRWFCTTGGSAVSGQMWTPAPKKGIIPLHPLPFGTVLGKSFSALRHNPRVLFGFAVIVQLVVILATAAIMTAVLLTTFMRLESVSPSSPDFAPLLAGTVAINALVGFGMGLAATAFTVIVQGVVTADVGAAALGDKATIGRLWRRMAPAFWRLIAFSLLQSLAVFGFLAIVVGIIVAVIVGGQASDASIGFVVLVCVLAVLAAIPLGVWLTTKLLLVPSVLVLERATLRTAFVRSWRLTRGRFWFTFGISFLISFILGVATNVVSVPLSLLTTMLTGVLAPTGANDASGIVGTVLAVLAPQVLVLILQAIAIVVGCTGATLVYLDARMRYEGLDQTLLSQVERRELGWTEEQLPDPFSVDPARAVSSAPPPRQAPAYPAPQPGWTSAPAQGYRPEPYGAPSAPPRSPPSAPPSAAPSAAPGGPAAPPPPPPRPDDSFWAPPPGSAS